MSYICYLGGMVFPTPSKLTVKTKNKNKTLVLLNEGEINFLRTAGLTEITVPFVLPMLSTVTPSIYLSVLETLKTNKKSTQFILVRLSPRGILLYDTNIKVSVEDYTITEDASKGLDVQVDVNLKQWRDYGTQTVSVQTDSSGQQTLSITQERDASTAPSASSYTVQSGDSLWSIAKTYYGDGADYTQIYDANSDAVSNPNSISVGQVLTLP